MRIFQSTPYYEGTSLVVYRDSLGYPTVGVGHLVLPEDDLKVGDVITQERCNELFDTDFAHAKESALDLISNPDSLPDIVMEMVTDNVFQMGKVGFSKFVRTINAIERQAWDEVADNLEDSLWYKQSGRRSLDIVAQYRAL